MNMYLRGRIAETKVANRLRDKGYFVRKSTGSRGPADIYARKGDTKLYVQVKTGSASMSSSEQYELRRLAQNRGGKAVYIKYNKGMIKSRFV